MIFQLRKKKVQKPTLSCAFIIFRQKGFKFSIKEEEGAKKRLPFHVHLSFFSNRVLNSQSRKKRVQKKNYPFMVHLSILQQ
jgi:hypothetical protein